MSRSLGRGDHRQVEARGPLHLRHLIELAEYAILAAAVVAAGVAIVASIAFYRAQREHAKTVGLLIPRAGALQLAIALAIIVAAGFLVVIYSIRPEHIVTFNK